MGWLLVGKSGFDFKKKQAIRCFYLMYSGSVTHQFHVDCSVDVSAYVRRFKCEICFYLLLVVFRLLAIQRMFVNWCLNTETN